EPAGPWGRADPRRRRVGALLLHRLPQCPAEISRSLRRQPHQLGLRARALRSGGEVSPLPCVTGKAPVRRGFFICAPSRKRDAAQHCVDFILRPNPPRSRSRASICQQTEHFMKLFVLAAAALSVTIAGAAADPLEQRKANMK